MGSLKNSKLLNLAASPVVPSLGQIRRIESTASTSAISITGSVQWLLVNGPS